MCFTSATNRCSIKVEIYNIKFKQALSVPSTSSSIPESIQYQNGLSMRLSISVIPLAISYVVEAHINSCSIAGGLCNSDWWRAAYGTDSPQCCGPYGSTVALFCSIGTGMIEYGLCPPGYMCVEVGSHVFCIPNGCPRYKLRVLRTAFLTLLELTRTFDSAKTVRGFPCPGFLHK